MSSCSNSTHIGLFRQRETFETDVSKIVAISLSVFPAKDISQAVKIIFVFERRIVNSSRKCENLAFQPSTPLILHYITPLVKLIFKKMQFFAIKMHDSSKKMRNSSKACKMDCDFCDGSWWSYKSQFRNSPLPPFRLTKWRRFASSSGRGRFNYCPRGYFKLYVFLRLKVKWLHFKVYTLIYSGGTRPVPST